MCLLVPRVYNAVCGSFIILENFLMAKKQESKEANFVLFGAYNVTKFSHSKQKSTMHTPRGVQQKFVRWYGVAAREKSFHFYLKWLGIVFYFSTQTWCLIRKRENIRFICELSQFLHGLKSKPRTSDEKGSKLSGMVFVSRIYTGEERELAWAAIEVF